MMMCESTHFSRAPIVEALIGIDFEQMRAEDVLPVLQELGETLKNEYPVREDIVLGQVEFALGQKPKQTDTPLGYFLKSKDGRQVVHAKRNGFAFSRLAPYEEWPRFFDEAKRTWGLYRKTIGPSKLAKWTVRYINKLSWLESESIKEYLEVYPHIPEGLPQTFQGCFMRLEFPVNEPCQGILTQQLVKLPPESEGTVSFMLDNEFSFSAIGKTDSAIWEAISESRHVKNQFFNRAITLKTKEMIK
jgi:uncharacterized protein (TIGR04255 family)